MDSILVAHVAESLERTIPDLGDATDEAVELLKRFASVRYSAKLYAANELTDGELDYSVTVALSNL